MRMIWMVAALLSPLMASFKIVYDYNSTFLSCPF